MACSHCGYDPCIRSPEARARDLFQVLLDSKGERATAALLSTLLDAIDGIAYGEPEPGAWPSLLTVLKALANLESQQPSLLRAVASRLIPPPGPGRPREDDSLRAIHKLLEIHFKPLPESDPEDWVAEIARDWRARDLQSYPWIPARLDQVRNLLQKKKGDVRISPAEALMLAAYAQWCGFADAKIEDLGNAGMAFSNAAKRLQPSRRRPRRGPSTK